MLGLRWWQATHQLLHLRICWRTRWIWCCFPTTQHNRLQRDCSLTSWMCEFEHCLHGKLTRCTKSSLSNWHISAWIHQNQQQPFDENHHQWLLVSWTTNLSIGQTSLLESTKNVHRSSNAEYGVIFKLFKWSTSSLFPSFMTWWMTPTDSFSLLSTSFWINANVKLVLSLKIINIVLYYNDYYRASLTAAWCNMLSWSITFMLVKSEARRCCHNFVGSLTSANESKSVLNVYTFLVSNFDASNVFEHTVPFLRTHKTSGFSDDLPFSVTNKGTFHWRLLSPLLANCVKLKWFAWISTVTTGYETWNRRSANTSRIVKESPHSDLLSRACKWGVCLSVIKLPLQKLWSSLRVLQCWIFERWGSSARHWKTFHFLLLLQSFLT